MKKNIFLFCLLFSLNSFSQNINGTIYDTNKVPLSGVIIYVDGTTFSTISDENGNFSLNYNPETNNVIVINFMGYQTEYIKGFDNKTNLDIYMVVSKNSLKEVVVNRKDMFTRAQKLKVFRENFIGETSNSKAVTIQNEDDIYFRYDKVGHVLKAFSDKPLIIINSSLGYKIYYELVSFELTFNKLSIYATDAVLSKYKGYTRFEEIMNSDETLKRREKTYEGSSLHFFRNLANHIWGKQEFLIGYKNKLLDPNNCFKVQKGEFFTNVTVTKQLEKNKIENFIASYDIVFNEKQSSNVIFTIDSFTIDKYGNNSNSDNIIFTGKISETRVGDMLPINYGIQ